MKALAVLLSLACTLVYAQPHETVVKTANDVTYLLTNANIKPKYVFIVMPGGPGILKPKEEDGRIVLANNANFLIRSRALFADNETVVVATDSVLSSARMQSIVADIKDRFGKDVKIWIFGSSSSTQTTMWVSKDLDGQVTGFVHTSSVAQIAWLNTKDSKSKHLIVHHKNDLCRLTPYSAAKNAAEDNNLQLITIDGGSSEGEYCGAYSYHGFTGVEKETVNQIKTWVKKEQ